MAFSAESAWIYRITHINDLDDLDRIDWEILSNSDFQYDPADPQKKARYQAEALIHRELPCSSLRAIACYNQAARSRVEAVVARHELSMPVVAKPGMFFG